MRRSCCICQYMLENMSVLLPRHVSIFVLEAHTSLPSIDIYPSPEHSSAVKIPHNIALVIQSGCSGLRRIPGKRRHNGPPSRASSHPSSARRREQHASPRLVFSCTPMRLQNSFQKGCQYVVHKANVKPGQQPLPDRRNRLAGQTCYRTTVLRESGPCALSECWTTVTEQCGRSWTSGSRHGERSTKSLGRIRGFRKRCY